jgi:restriction system protein
VSVLHSDRAVSVLPKILWGIHAPLEVGEMLVTGSFVSLGWAKIGDISKLKPDREAFKKAVGDSYPDAKPGAIPVWAGVLYRYVHEMKVGDGVAFPSKHDRNINLGFVSGDVEFNPKSKSEALCNRRKVEWVRHVSRTTFSQVALNEIGSALSLFQIANNVEEFRQAFSGIISDPTTIDETSVEIASEQVEETTEDYVLKRLKSAINPVEFEHFVAMLLRAMGYFARVTKKSGDGGVDVIAHRDELGIDPPRIHVQCKQKTDKIGRPDVQKLHGAIPSGDHGLFVTLGTYSNDAQSFEQAKGNLRLIDGSTLTELIYKYYDKLDSSAQRMVPLKRIFIPSSSSI